MQGEITHEEFIDPVMSFWFGHSTLPLKEPEEKWQSPNDHAIPTEVAVKWYRKDEAFDNAIRERFGLLVELLLSSNPNEPSPIDSWLDTPKGALAALVVLDQFPRNLYRCSPKAFQLDAKALEVAELGLAKGFDKRVKHPLQAWLFYHPFEHSESLDIQALSVKKYNELKDNVDPSDVSYGFITFGIKAVQEHYDIIAKFGRFPHRNVVLGRESTPEELEHLKVHAGF